MKSLLIGLVLAGALSIVTGCAGVGYSGGPATARIPQEAATGENQNRTVRAWFIDSREIVDDFNAVMMLDKPSHLTKWNVR